MSLYLCSQGHHESSDKEAEAWRATRNLPEVTLLINDRAGVSEGLYGGIEASLGIMVGGRRWDGGAETRQCSPTVCQLCASCLSSSALMTLFLGTILLCPFYR